MKAPDNTSVRPNRHLPFGVRAQLIKKKKKKKREKKNDMKRISYRKLSSVSLLA